MKKRLGALMLALTVIFVSDCNVQGVGEAFGIKNYTTGNWILSDMKESFD